jgi:dimethylamine/trimethylamine dehydrogenase
VTYVTSQPLIAAWTVMTDEQYLIEKRFRELEITAHVSHMLTHVSPGTARFDHSLSRAPVEMTFGSLIMVTGRVPRDDLYGPLVSGHGEGFVTRIGDCLNPSHIADAVFGGHRFAQEYGEPRPLPALRRERPDF